MRLIINWVLDNNISFSEEFLIILDSNKTETRPEKCVCLSVFDHFVGLALKELSKFITRMQKTKEKKFITL